MRTLTSLSAPETSRHIGPSAASLCPCRACSRVRPVKRHERHEHCVQGQHLHQQPRTLRLYLEVGCLVGVSGSLVVDEHVVSRVYLDSGTVNSGAGSYFPRSLDSIVPLRMLCKHLHRHQHLHMYLHLHPHCTCTCTCTCIDTCT